MKKILSVILIVSVLLTMAGCSGMGRMPFNGPIEFHDIGLTVPEKFIRDSTKSDKDKWIYEYDSYEEYILIMRKDFSGDVTTTLEDYAAYMQEHDAKSEIVSFLDGSAVHSTYSKDRAYCQEMLFVYGDSVYAVALRDGTTEDFEAVINSLHIIEKEG